VSMSGDTAQALLRLAETLERAARQLRELAGNGDLSPRRKAAPLPDEFIEQLRSLERSIAAQQLASLTHKQLGDVFVKVGGTGGDRKRGKDWLLERILWHLFDFQAGHEIIRGTRGNQT
jgi:hypothetical protein